MTNEEILAAAKEAGISRTETGLNLSAVERFATIIEKRTIERCVAALMDQRDELLDALENCRLLVAGEVMR